MSDRLFTEWRARSEACLEAALASLPDAPERLLAAMRHSTLAGGKRMRPLLAYATGHALGVDASRIDHAASAVELVHAYSLIHDDLPAMDDDDLRRGQPTVHVAFDEATAILAGDALQTLAFQQLTGSPLDAGIRIRLVSELSQAAGAAGMCGGQAIDLDATGQTLALDALQRMHALKTGALIRAAVRMGAICAEADDPMLASLDTFAAALGLAFQIRDDILDVEASSEALGKTAGKDADADKATYVSLLGLDGSRAALAAEHQRMRDTLSTMALPDSQMQPLSDLADLAVARSN
ncbi:MAG: polyprenyl synthetase family protein [Lysobacteraceae bacterium]